MGSYIDDAFGAGGLLSSGKSDYVPRQGQIDCAYQTDKAFEQKRIAVIEAPCGVGKSFAYLVPAAYHASRGKKVLVVTAGILLQEQIIKKDLPTLQKILPWKFSFAIFKGRNNYLCLDRALQPELKIGDDRDVVHAGLIAKWARETRAGDKSELPFEPSEKVWSAFSVGSKDCKRHECMFKDECFSNRMKQDTVAASIVVTNYHMFFTQLAQPDAKILPPFDLVVFDEAHEAADIARDYFGTSISYWSIVQVGSALDKIGALELGTQLRELANAFFLKAAEYRRSDDYSVRLRVPGWINCDELVALLSEQVLPALEKHLTVLEQEKKNLKKVNMRLNRPKADRLQMLKRAAELADESVGLLDDMTWLRGEEERVYWIDEREDRDGRSKLCSMPVNVGPLLAEGFFSNPDIGVVLMSATLTVNNAFVFFREEVGLDGELGERVDELVVDSPFDFGRQAMLVIPDNVIEPKGSNDPAFVQQVCEIVQSVVDECEGRTLVLFTANARRDACAAALKTKHRVLKQGEMPKSELIRAFKDDVHSVLLGVDSFWTGVDVPGESLTALVIDKISFMRPDEPLIDWMQSKRKSMEVFMSFIVPKAVIMMRQGIGRLIRSKDDHGVIVLCDRRLLSKSYGKIFLNSFPRMQRGSDRLAIRSFLGQFDQIPE